MFKLYIYNVLYVHILDVIDSNMCVPLSTKFHSTLTSAQILGKLYSE